MELYLDDDGEDRHTILEQDDEIRAILRRLEISEGRLLDARLGEARNVETERTLEQLGREARTISEQKHQRFVHGGRHRTAPRPHARSSCVLRDARNVRRFLDHLAAWIAELASLAAEQGPSDGLLTIVSYIMARTLLLQMRARFGELAADVEARVNSASSEELDRWTARILVARTIEELFAAS